MTYAAEYTTAAETANKARIQRHNDRVREWAEGITARRTYQSAFAQGGVAFRILGNAARNPHDLAHEPLKHDAWNNGFRSAAINSQK